MPKSTDPIAQAKRRRDAWQSAVTATLLRLLAAVLLLWLRTRCRAGGLGEAVTGLIAVLELGTIVPVWILLKQRLKEIEGGEEDAAAQY